MVFYRWQFLEPHKFYGAGWFGGYSEGVLYGRQLLFRSRAPSHPDVPAVGLLGDNGGTLLRAHDAQQFAPSDVYALPPELVLCGRHDPVGELIRTD